MSDAEDTRPADLPPLHDAVDPEALDEVFGPPENGRAAISGSISFPYSDSVVTIQDGTRIRIEAQSNPS